MLRCVPYRHVHAQRRVRRQVLLVDVLGVGAQVVSVRRGARLDLLSETVVRVKTLGPAAKLKLVEVNCRPCLVSSKSDLSASMRNCIRGIAWLRSINSIK